MLYLEDYLEMIEHLPTELRDRFTEMREMDLSVQNRVDSLEEEQKVFFANCASKKLKGGSGGEREAEFERIRREYSKVIEDASEKVALAEDSYALVDKYMRKLDQELHKFKLELEADHRGITETLEKNSLDMDQQTQQTHKENRHPKKHGRKHHHTTTHHSHTPYVKTDRKTHYNDATTTLDTGSGLSVAAAGTCPLQHMGAGGNAIAAAASQAIAATQQLTGRRTSSLKASFEAINLGVQTHEFSVGRELAGAAQTALAATQLTGVPGQQLSPYQEVTGNKRNKKGTGSRSTPATMLPSNTPLVDVVNSGGSVVEEILEATLVEGNVSPTTEDLLGGGGNATPEQDWSYDPSEPRYCICNQVSYGDMVACDNEDCPYEWFHYPCVGIEAPPKGKWYCPTCTGNMQRRKGRK